MLHGSHLMLGIGIFLVLSPILGIPITAVGLLIAALSSLIPDIDHPKSFISHWNAFTQMLSRGVASVTTHRGITHTVYGMTVWVLMVLFTLQYFHIGGGIPILFGAFAGYFSHLLADSLNPQGVHWMGKEFNIHTSGPINTGSKVEKYTVPLMFIGLVVLYLRLTQLL